MNKEAIKQVVQSPKFAVIVSSVVSLAAGATGGYLVARKKLITKYSDMAQEEIQEARKYYAKRNKVDEFADPVTLAAQYNDEGDETDFLDDTTTDEDFRPQTEMVREAAKILEEQQYVDYREKSKPEPKQEEVIAVKQSIRKNVFDNRDPDEDHGAFDEAVELDKKARNLPYIVTQEEFFENEDDRSDGQFLYFGDGAQDVLVEQPNDSIVDVSVVGSDNLKFGYGSKDKNIVYIVDPNLDIQYEVIRQNGSYEAYIGLQHSMWDDNPTDKRIKRMRRDDY